MTSLSISWHVTYAHYCRCFNKKPEDNMNTTLNRTEDGRLLMNWISTEGCSSSPQYSGYVRCRVTGATAGLHLTFPDTGNRSLGVIGACGGGVQWCILWLEWSRNSSRSVYDLWQEPGTKLWPTEGAIYLVCRTKWPIQKIFCRMSLSLDLLIIAKDT